MYKKILKSPFSDFCEDAHNFTTLFFVHLPLRRALCINITSLTVNCCMSYDYIIELVGYCVCTTFNSCLCARVSIIAAFILKSVSHLFNFPAEAVNLYKNPNEVIFLMTHWTLVYFFASAVILTNWYLKHVYLIFKKAVWENYTENKMHC